ncbi:MAG: hypothetical protein HY821_21610 [Acidobacteria bacterium]|nr:hypothetical protein [Acidobacteriota bacterium]
MPTPFVRVLLAALLLAAPASPQILSPKVLQANQPDPTHLKAFAETICRNARAVSPRQRAEAIWRYFLTDGRFVAPGFFYHIAGWAYEEPSGEVLDPLKLLNSYGFGLCYHIAPLLEAVYEAAGFSDARVWFLTGHTVAEVFYDGAYHHFDSDMLGYTTLNGTPPASGPVASVAQLAADPSIFLNKLRPNGDSNPDLVPNPWYPADVRARAIPGLAELFSTRNDNYLFPFTRSPQGHSMAWQLRPGETFTRYFQPEQPGLFYLPYRYDGKTYTEFPREIAQYSIRTEDGPRSQKDARLWATGRFDYQPTLSQARRQVFPVESPYVIINAEFQLDVQLPAGESAAVDISIDQGRTWHAAGRREGPFTGVFTAAPEALTTTEHGTRTLISGRYAYLFSVLLSPKAKLNNARLATRVQVNPRTLPALHPGLNELHYTSGARPRHNVAPDPAIADARFSTDGAQGYWLPTTEAPAILTYRLANAGEFPLTAFAAGARFLDLSTGLAPDKFTAETRKAQALPPPARKSATIAWATKPQGPWKRLYTFPSMQSKEQSLLWPETDHAVALPAPAPEIYVRYQFAGLAVDSIRLATETAPSRKPCALQVTHQYTQDGQPKTHTESIPAGLAARAYKIDTPTTAKIENTALILECRQ